MKTLTQAEIRKLHGVAEGKQVIAFGRCVTTEIGKRKAVKQDREAFLKAHGYKVEADTASEVVEKI